MVEFGRVGDELQHKHGSIAVGTWNVRGMTDLKLHELILHMETYDINILCLQETWCKQADVYTERGYFIRFSGSTGGERCWSGVGFIIAPSFRPRVRSYKQFDDRIAYLK